MLTHAIRETPYTAVVQYTKFEVVPLASGEDKRIYHARVLRTIRGAEHQTITYFAIVEMGDSESFTREPIILSLCQNREGYYWAGVGTVFAATDAMRSAAAKVVRTVPADQSTFKYCE